MASLWEYANPVKFLRISEKVLPGLWVLSVSCLGVGLVWGFFFTPDDYRQGSTPAGTIAPHLKFMRKTVAAAYGISATTPAVIPANINNGVCVANPSAPRRATSAPKIRVGM